MQNAVPTTLKACAAQILAGTPTAAPGTGFLYGGAAFSVAGAMAEYATGSSWAALFDARMAAPGRLTATSYGSGDNPVLSEGNVVATLGDYGRFAQMILEGGMAGATRI